MLTLFIDDIDAHHFPPSAAFSEALRVATGAEATDRLEAAEIDDAWWLSLARTDSDGAPTE
ncbi:MULTISPECIES: hypothetical protein [unclassified Aeromicrobium]|uniref:hypothetical protein n=1 Tax=unclassified Aeromicrobium TaxID=2633570 RepID=UPI0020982E74|nr:MULTISPECIES: hypothetical protein [unclassified Aeromicrobium]MCO7240644.1 hypothetical protein [Aeromicrobium sp. CnD17-E]MDR6118509.1 hypothetical protein [Aeromicrobium sp. SORGH_AS_0981]